MSWVAKTRRLKEFECETAGCQDGAVSGAHRDWGQEEEGTTEDEMAGWHHRLNGCEFV